MPPLTLSVAAGILDNNCKCAIFSALETRDKAESERTGWPAPLHCTRVDISRETLVSGNYIHFAVQIFQSELLCTFDNMSWDGWCSIQTHLDIVSNVYCNILYSFEFFRLSITLERIQILQIHSTFMNMSAIRKLDISNSLDILFNMENVE